MIFAFGDSIMKGIVTDQQRLDRDTIKYIISDGGFANRIGCPVRNLSRFGSTVIAGQRHLQRHLAEIHPGDKVVLEFGGNDCNYDWSAVAADPTGHYSPTVSLRDFRTIYEQMIRCIRGVGAEPVLLSLPPLLPPRFFDFVSQGLNAANILAWLGGDVNTTANWHEQYNLEVFKTGTRHGVEVIDISSIFLAQRGLDDYYCIDGMHPNERGHALIAEAIAETCVLA